MTIPTSQSIMLPLLQFARDEEIHKMREAIEHLTEHFMNNEFNLTEKERTEFYPSGKGRKFDHRVNWAKFYLKKAGLVKKSGRGSFQITESGLDILRTNPPKIDKKLLKSLNILEDAEFVSGKPKKMKSDVIPSEEENTSASPKELIEDGYNKINKNLSEDLLSEIMECSPAFFEKLIVDLMLAMGYGGTEGTGQVVGKSNDEGIDGIIKEDKLGLDVIYLQAKRWQKGDTIRSKEIRGFVGSLTGGKNKGVFITTSTFTTAAEKYIKTVSDKQVVLIDGTMLTNLMIKYNVGVSTESSYEIKKMDFDYFEE